MLTQSAQHGLGDARTAIDELIARLRVDQRSGRMQALGQDRLALGAREARPSLRPPRLGQGPGRGIERAHVAHGTPEQLGIADRIVAILFVAVHGSSAPSH